MFIRESIPNVPAGEIGRGCDWFHPWARAFSRVPKALRPPPRTIRAIGLPF